MGAIKNLLMQYRRILIVVVQILLINFSYIFAYALRFDLEIPSDQVKIIFKTLPLLVLVRICFFYYYGLFKGWWQYVDMHDLFDIIKAISFSSFTFLVGMVFLFNLRAFPRSVFIIDWFLLIILTGGIRFALRLVRERSFSLPEKDLKNILIVGAGGAGETIVREMKKDSKLNMEPIGFIDDNPQKKGIKIQGVQVLGNRKDLPKILEKRKVDELIVAIHNVTEDDLKDILETCHYYKVKFKRIPAFRNLLDGSIDISQIREVKLEDLLFRDVVDFRKEENAVSVKEEIAGKTVMVTGAGGSIGSELSRQIATLNSENLILLERDESKLHDIYGELSQNYPQPKITPLVRDILNRERLELVFKDFSPQIIYHAAAYKQVPEMEKNPLEAIENNIFGTRGVARLAIKYKAEKFIQVSTDKAVNPTSVMGATKRAVELYLSSMDQSGNTSFVTVRFGNVLGSVGSVIPLFKKQISDGGPITVTHPEIERYFMTIPEAVYLVILAGALGRGGDIFVLEMGKQVKVLDVATNLIKLSGLEPEKDIKIVYIGLRPGEKLSEELFSPGIERIVATSIEKINLINLKGNKRPEFIQIEKKIDQFAELIPRGDKKQALQVLKAIVPEYVFLK